MWREGFFILGKGGQKLVFRLSWPEKLGRKNMDFGSMVRRPRGGVFSGPTPRGGEGVWDTPPYYILHYIHYTLYTTNIYTTPPPLGLPIDPWASF